jgi:hypothetical protein
MATNLGTAGDPGFSFKRAFKIPKKLRKLKVGRALGGVAASVIPGVGPVLGAIDAFRPQRSAQTASVAAGGMSPELLGLIQQLRAMGLPVGDPGLPLVGLAAGLLPGLIGKAGKAIGGLISSPIGRVVTGGLVSGAAGAGLGALIGGGGPARGFRSSRRMNVGNVRALRRSMRRVEGFAKLARSTISFTKQTRMKARGRGRK